MNFVALVLGLLGQSLLGWAIARRILKSGGENAPSYESAGLGVTLGIALNAWLAFGWSLAGGRLGPEIAWTVSAAGWLCGVYCLVRRRSEPAAATSAAPTSPVTILCSGCVGICILAAFAQAVAKPQHLWDERAIFGIKAKVLEIEGTIDAPLLAHPDFVQGHPKYPLLVPLAEQNVYALLGTIDDRWSKVVFPLLYTGLLLSFAGVLTRQIGSAGAWLFTAMLATVPSLMPSEYGFLSGQADATVACFHGLAVCYLWDLLRSRRCGGSIPPRIAVLAGICAASAAFTKDEGIAFLIVDTVALTMAILFSIRGAKFGSASLMWIGFLSAAAIPLLPWFLHRRTLPATTEMTYAGRLADVLSQDARARLAWILPHLGGRMFREWSQHGLQWWMSALALVTAPRRALAAEQVFLLLSLIGSLSALVIAGLIAPVAVEDHLGGSSDRFLLQLAPVAVLIAAGQWGATD